MDLFDNIHSRIEWKQESKARKTWRSVAACTHQPWSSSLRAFDARSAACCHLARGFLIEKSTAQALPVLQQINASELKASHESAHASAAPSDPPFKYKKAAPSLLQTTSLPASFPFFQTPLPTLSHREDGICSIRLGEMLRQWTRTPCQYWFEKDSKDVWQFYHGLQVSEEAGIPTGGFAR